PGPVIRPSATSPSMSFQSRWTGPAGPTQAGGWTSHNGLYRPWLGAQRRTFSGSSPSMMAEFRPWRFGLPAPVWPLTNAARVGRAALEHADAGDRAARAC